MSVYLPGISQDPSITFGTGNSGANGGTGGGGIPTFGFGGDPAGTLFRDAQGTRWNLKGQSWDEAKGKWVDGENGPWSLPSNAPLGPSTPASMAETAAIANGSSVPAALSTGFPAATSVASNLTGDLLRYALPTAGSVIGGIIQANAAGNASEAQQRYLEEALAYEKEKDKGNIEREGGRYNDYRGNIAPYLATGQAANARMASLLGLSPSANPYGGPVYQPTAPSAPLPQPPPTTNDPTNPYGKPVGGFDPNVAHPISTQPAGRTTAPPQTQTVPMVGPDGSQQNVPANQVEYWQSKGAKLMGAVA